MRERARCQQVNRERTGSAYQLCYDVLTSRRSDARDVHLSVQSGKRRIDGVACVRDRVNISIIICNCYTTLALGVSCELVVPP